MGTDYFVSGWATDSPAADEHIWAIVRILQSGADTGIKVLWVVVILVLPLLGLILRLLFGPK